MKALAGLVLSLCMAATLAPASAQQASDGGTSGQLMQLAQYRDPGYDYNDVYVDEYGRRVTVDALGRVIAVEPSRRERFRERRRRFEDRRGGAVIDGPPPPGVTLEGPVADVPPGVFDRPDPAYRDRRRPRSADPYSGGDNYDNNAGYDRNSGGRGYDGPVQAAPLPAPAQRGQREAVLPPNEANQPAGDAGAAADLPEPGDSILKPDGASDALAPGEGQDIQETNPAPQVASPGGKSDRAQVAALQVLLDRAGMSPGVIDGRMGSNVNKAVAAYEEKFHKKLPTGDPKALADDLDATGGPAIITYEITAEDVAGPYVASIPSDYAEKAQLPELGYQSVSEKLAEKFHMDENYLKEINPGVDFDRQGTRIKVANVGPNATGDVAKIIADKGREQVRAYDASGTLIAAYPSTIGSTSTPSPSGTVQVNRVAFNPNYTYNPKINFKQGSND